MSKAECNNSVVDLILKVRQGDQQAFIALLQRYKPLLDSLISKLFCDDLARRNEEDLRQEATVVFYNAILTYDEMQSEVEFGLYARICISNALASQMRVINRRRAEQLTEPDSNAFCDNCFDDLSHDVVQKENLDFLYSVIRKNLSPYEYDIWQSYMLGKTAREIGSALGKDEKSVNNAIYRIRRKLRQLLK